MLGGDGFKTYHESDHGVEIFPRRLKFTTEEKLWRKTAASFLWTLEQKNKPPSSSSTTQIIHESRTAYNTNTSFTSKELKTKTLRAFRDQLIEILLTLRIINEILKIQYRSPDWGNQPHLIDELVYILLSRRSKIEDTKRHFWAIKERYPTWEAVAFAPVDELKATIAGGGLEDHKAGFIQGSLQVIHQKFGRISEDDFATMSNVELDKFLRRLPGVGPKSSACILMYARKSDIFPADTHCIRILDRLGLFSIFGFKWSQINHKQAENDLLELIPPHIRNDLHRNLLALGRKICKPTKPLCNQCELKKFCAYYRSEQQKQLVSTCGDPVAIEMFCGAGGFSLGLRRAGFKVVGVVDNDSDAIRTYRLNHSEIPDEAIIHEDARSVDLLDMLKTLLGDQKLDLLVGGPPCQGFSMMGNRVPHKYENGDKKFGENYDFQEDERNHLFETMIDIAGELQPHYVVIENVPGLGSAEIEEKSYADHIAECLQGFNYQTRVMRLEAADFGVPQKRHRYFIFGSHPEATLLDLSVLEVPIPDEDRTQLKHALFDLPPLSISDGKWIAAHTSEASQQKELAARYLRRFQIRGKTKILYNHISRYQNEDDIELFSKLRQGETYRELVERIGWQPFTKYKVENFEDKYYRLMWDDQSKTIVSHLAKDGNSFVAPHPEPDRQIRSISVREAARIQSFPDDYIFCGSRGRQFIQIGNAVPPVVAEAIGRVLLKALNSSINS